MVLVDRVGDDRECWSVVVDDVRGGQLALRRVAETGHTSIAFLGHPGTSPKVRSRLTGVEAALKDWPRASLELIEAENWTIEAGAAAGRDIVSRTPGTRPTAIICANDMLALGLQVELLRGGVRIPEDIAIVGYDDLVWASFASVPLTTVRQPRQELGRTAVDMVMELLVRPGERRLPRSNHVVLQPELVVRDSA